MSAAEVIREARNVLFERGWFQGDFEGKDGAVCIEGAFCHALGISYDECTSSDAWNDADEVVRRVLLERYDRSLASSAFNDEFAESFDDVLDVLDRAEKIAEAREVAS